MRQIGTLAEEQDARRFADYLLTRGIKGRIDSEDDGWALWVYDEDQVDSAKEELTRFVDSPGDPVYHNAAGVAQSLRKAEKKLVRRVQKRTVDIRRRWEQPLAASCPVTMSLIFISVVVVVLGSTMKDLWRLCDKTEPILTYLYISPIETAGWDRRLGLNPLHNGQVWRIVTPIFLHFSVLHIVFNMIWLRTLGTIVEFHRGRLRFLFIVLLIAVASNYSEFVWSGHPFFGGMSGVVFGLFGYLWMKSRYEPESGLFMHPNIVFWMILWLVLCYTGVVGRIANAAHTAGLGMGMFIGILPTLVRRIREKR